MAIVSIRKDVQTIQTHDSGLFGAGNLILLHRLCVCVRSAHMRYVAAPPIDRQFIYF